MAELKNEFAWSKSRDEKYRCCPRQYWFHYYGAWGGWDRKAAERTRAIYVLKQLESRQTWMGSTVHNCLRWVLDELRQNGEAPPEEKTLQFLGKRMRKDYVESGEGLYWDDPKNHVGLLEHEYDERDAPDTEWHEIFEKALRCVSTFYHSGVFDQLRRLPRDRWLEVENLASIALEGVKVWVQLDCAHRDGGGVVIYDWKTGRADAASTREQLACYILYAVERWGAPPDAVLAREFNLAHDAIHESRLTADALADARALIAKAAAELAAIHGAPEERFDFTENESECARCNFARLCPKLIGAADG
jgi:hypothetical protein